MPPFSSPSSDVVGWCSYACFDIKLREATVPRKSFRFGESLPTAHTRLFRPVELFSACRAVAAAETAVEEINFQGFLPYFFLYITPLLDSAGLADAAVRVAVAFCHSLSHWLKYRASCAGCAISGVRRGNQVH
jgi:hypothetical protein